MKKERIHTAVTLAQRLAHVFVATADADGLPHMAAAGRIAQVSDRHVALSAWFCPSTVKNIAENRRLALVVWDAVADIGYQLLGEVESVKELSSLDGFDPEIEAADLYPQTEKELRVRIDKVIAFSHAPHSDKEE